MRKKSSVIPHNLPSIGVEEQIAAERVLASGWLAQGAEVEAFENELSQFFHLPQGHVVVVSSGTAALYLGLWVLDGTNRRVGLPVYACSALRNAIGLINAKAEYLDCAANNPNIEGTSAISANIDILIAPSLFGIPVEIPPQTTSKRPKIIEDVAQSLGAMASCQRIGLRGDVGICSFYATKMITSGGQGGAVISRDKRLIDKIRDYREFDCRDDVNLRFNFQMTDLQAAIGRAQLKKLPLFIQQREQIFSIYRAAGLDLLDAASTTSYPVRYRAVMCCRDPTNIIQRLAENGVKAIVPVERRELLGRPESYPIAKLLTEHTVSLPIFPSLHEDNAKSIANIVKNLL